MPACEMNSGNLCITNSFSGPKVSVMERFCCNDMVQLTQSEIVCSFKIVRICKISLGMCELFEDQ